ncbi:MAG TPA: WYL domain-containing protein [Solimonas sp.]|nr:WYL domain-containing protein [Solimonas sp.]
MDRTERFYKIDRLLRSRKVTPLGVFLDELGISRATFKRDLEYLRDRFNAPILWDADAGGYRYTLDDQPDFALPGFWLSGTEVQALLTLEHFIERLEPGLVGPLMAPLRRRLAGIAAEAGASVEQLRRRVRVLQIAARPVSPPAFNTVADALLRRRRIELEYAARVDGEVTRREVSPQRLLHYRDNWYLDAWCHWRCGLRSFAVDAIRRATMLETPADDIDDAHLVRELEGGYGIFSGEARHLARLRFTPQRARWVAQESWHPQQRGHFEDDGSYVLELPYADDRELIGDILRHGAGVEVLEPAELRAGLRSALEQTLARYPA